MARRSNFYYQNPWDSIGKSLGTALFGDPQMAAAQQEASLKAQVMSAQADREAAHARLYGNQADGVGIQNQASLSLPELAAGWMRRSSAAPAPADPLAPLPEAGMPVAEAPAQFDPDAFRAGLPRFLATLAQMQGDKVDPNALVGGLAAMLGDDEMARRGMVAQGKTPGEDFALTMGRADDISARDAKEDLNEAVSVENIRSSDRRYGDDRSYAARTYAADRSYDGRTYAADRTLDGKVYGADSKDYDRAGAIAVGNRLGTVTNTVRSEKHNKDVGGVANSYHLASRGGRGIDIARGRGVTHAQVVQSYRDAGYTILADLDEGDHSHLALAGGPNAGKSGAKSSGKPAAAKPVPQGVTKQLSEAVDARAGEEGWDDLPPRAKNNLMAYATQQYQRHGNAALAINETFQRWAELRPKAAGGKPAAQPQAKPAAQPTKRQQNTDQLRQQAKASIGQGADPAAVRARFKQMTGQNL